MAKLAVIATIKFSREQRDRVLSLLMAHRARCLKDEPEDTLQFEVLVPREDDTRLLSYEVYRDDAAFERHRSAPSINQFRADIAGMGVRVQVTRCALAE